MPSSSENIEENTRFSDNPQFEEWTGQIMTMLFKVNGHLSTLQQFIKTLQKSQEQGNTRSKMVANIDKKSVFHVEETSTLLKSINDLVHKINGIQEVALDKAQLISRDKLTRDVKYSVQEFQEAQKEFMQISKSMNEEAKAALAEDEQTRQESTSFAPKQQVVIEREAINNEEFAYQQNLIQQREEEISHIESGVLELNEIFRDLGSIVQQQGHLVDNIENNIYSVATDAQSGARELTKAMRSQRNSNRWCVRILLVVSVLLVMFILVVFS
ncbi:LAQU0S04e00738g1_1 [Lachancea quebecensis]|uniref:LAQU0S04e00738g1_1 n=1 Tax=Lachancea quebecensis TaxID=1654605 RepID=A0A0P1KPI9_9SACH|nr:LAQU0S04e00738g1_1 [Lachancea quebecensis]